MMDLVLKIASPLATYHGQCQICMRPSGLDVEGFAHDFMLLALSGQISLMDFHISKAADKMTITVRRILGMLLYKMPIYVFNMVCQELPTIIQLIIQVVV